MMESTDKATDQSFRDLTKVDALNKGWNSDLEKLIVDIEDKSWAYTWMHNASVNYLSRWNDKLSIATIALNILTGTSTFATLNTCSTLLWVQISTGFVIYIGAFIAGYQKYHRLEERVEKHKQAASKYSALYHSIQAEIGLHQHERQRAKEFVTWATDQYDNLLLSSPDVDDKILKMYFDLYKEDKRAQPVIYNYHQGPIVPIKDYKGNDNSKKIDTTDNERTDKPMKSAKPMKSDAEKYDKQDKPNKQEEPVEKKDDDIPRKALMDTKGRSIRRRRKNASKNRDDKGNREDGINDDARIFKSADNSEIPSVTVKSSLETGYHDSSRPNYISPPPPSDFREMKSQLLNRNTYTNYFHQYDDKLLKYQMERMNSLRRTNE